MVSMTKDKRECQAVPDRSSGIVVGIDVSKRKMTFAAFRPDEKSRVFTLNQDAGGFRALVRFLDELRSDGYIPWVAFEPTGPYSTCLKEWLLYQKERVVQVNGYHVKRTKEVRDNSPEKDDLKDPRVIADLVWQGCYQEVLELPEEYQELRCASAEWASLSKRKTALRNEFQSLLEVWFPELVEIFKDPLCRSVRALVRRYEDAPAIAQARMAQIEGTLRKASAGRTVGRAEEIRTAARKSVASAKGQHSRRQAMVFLLEMLELVESRREALRARMQEMLLCVPGSQEMLSIKGVGVITVAGVLGECGPLSRYKSFKHLEKFIGLNLFEISSGQFKGQRHISKRGRALARYLICQAAMQQVRKDGLFRGYADGLKAKGKKSGQIRVAVARKLLRLLYAIARDQREFDPCRFFTGGRMEDGPAYQQGTQQTAA